MVLAPIALALLLDPTPSFVALLAILAGLLVTLGIALWLAQPGAEREDANLVMARPGARPATWIVAHLDTKAQGQSMAGRLVALWVALLAVLAALGAATWHRDGELPDGAALGVAVGLLLAGRLLVRGRLQGRTAGACDNGSGLVALLVAAGKVRGDGVGFVVTGAEEFGLVGATALAKGLPERFRGAQVVNLDTLDDAGTVYVVYHDTQSLALAARLRAELAGVAPVVRPRKLPLGILVDSLPLAPVAGAAVTVARLDWATLRRVHTPADAPGSLSYGTAVAVGEVLAAQFDHAPAGG